MMKSGICLRRLRASLVGRVALVGRVTPCAPFGAVDANCGAHGVTRRTFRVTEETPGDANSIDQFV